jgi:hypothetical protein
MVMVTVVVPTHDHGATLRRSVASALAQTVRDLEVFIVGDGVPDAARPVISDLVNQDSRIRFFDQPKGERHGERHRHEALAQARGRIVCYLGDDDLWLPDHLEIMDRALHGADLVHTLTMMVDPDGRMMAAVVDVAKPGYLEMLRRNHGSFGLSCGGHTLEAYRKLPHGGRPAPPELNSDCNMWIQFLEQPWCRAASLMRPTVLKFPNPQRKAWPTERRLEELDRYAERIERPEGIASLRLELLEALACERIHQLDEVRDQLSSELAELERLRAERDRERKLLEQLQREVVALHGSRSWRWTRPLRQLVRALRRSSS